MNSYDVLCLCNLGDHACFTAHMQEAVFPKSFFHVAMHFCTRKLIHHRATQKICHATGDSKHRLLSIIYSYDIRISHRGKSSPSLDKLNKLQQCVPLENSTNSSVVLIVFPISDGQSTIWFPLIRPAMKNPYD